MSKRWRRAWPVVIAIVAALTVVGIHVVVDWLTRDQLPGLDVEDYSRIEEGLYLGASVPEPPPGCRAVLNLCERDDPYQVEVHRWEPIRDAAPAPSVDWLRRQVEFVDAQCRSGLPVFVHCRNGISRSGMVLTAYVMWRDGSARDEALALVRSRRPGVRPNPAFMGLLLEWEQVLRTQGRAPNDRDALSMDRSRLRGPRRSLLVPEGRRGRILSSVQERGVFNEPFLCLGHTMATQAEPKWVPITRWAPLAGNWNIAARGARYEGATAPGGYGLAICDERFRDGLVRAKVRFEGQDAPLKAESAGIVLGYHSESGGYLVAGLGAFDLAYAIWEFMPAAGWVNRKAVGAIQNLRYNKDYQLEVTQRGQRISLVVDDVPVLEHVLPSPPPGNQLGLYAMSDSAVQFQDYEVQRRAPTAFVAMQFGEPYDTIYRTVIRPEAIKRGFEVIRIDEVNRPGIIFQDIQRKIEDAKVVIAEITAPNQNVYYEVGYAHALNKPTILLAQRGKELPFDIRSYRVIFYDDSIGGKPLVEKTLRAHLHAILQEI